MRSLCVFAVICTALFTSPNHFFVHSAPIETSLHEDVIDVRQHHIITTTTAPVVVNMKASRHTENLEAFQQQNQQLIATQAIPAPATLPQQHPEHTYPGEMEIDQRKAEFNAITATQNNFNIDAVVGWVQIEDSEPLKKELQMLLEKSEANAPFYIGKGEWPSDDELKYTLRSLLHFGIFRKIHVLVSDQQTLPQWLDVHNTKLNIVTHTQVFERSSMDLPTFNPLAIEANVHRIPGLAEHFVYFTQGMVLTAPVSRSDFFTTEGRPVQYFQDKYDSYRESDWQSNVRLTTEHVINRSYFGLHNDVQTQVVEKFIPLPHFRALLRSDVQAVAETYSEEMARTSHHKLMRSEDLSLLQLSAAYTLFNKHAVIAHWNQFEIQFVDATSPAEFTELRVNAPKLALISTPSPTELSDAKTRATVHMNLEHLFPFPCAVEKVAALLPVENVPESPKK